MRKMQLDLDALRVDSFPTAEEGDERGTVLAREIVMQYSGYATCGCACSGTDGIRICKSCGPSCYE